MYGEYCNVCCWYQADAGVCENRTGGGCLSLLPSGLTVLDATEAAPVVEQRSTKRQWWWYDYEGD